MLSSTLSAALALSCFHTPTPAFPAAEHPALLSRRAILGGAALIVGCACPSLAMEESLPLPPHTEPVQARRLLELCRSRRPSDWTADERPEVDRLVQELVDLRAPWPSEGLRGKWRLAYLQPGPTGAGIDRRVPFPEVIRNSGTPDLEPAT